MPSSRRAGPVTKSNTIARFGTGAPSARLRGSLATRGPIRASVAGRMARRGLGICLATYRCGSVVRVHVKVPARGRVGTSRTRARMAVQRAGVRALRRGPVPRVPGTAPSARIVISARRASRPSTNTGSVNWAIMAAYAGALQASGRPITATKSALYGKGRPPRAGGSWSGVPASSGAVVGARSRVAPSRKARSGATASTPAPSMGLAASSGVSGPPMGGLGRAIARIWPLSSNGTGSRNTRRGTASGILADIST